MRGVLFAAAVAVSAAVAAPASAALVVATYTGTASGTDNLGYFGTPGASYAGTAFTAIFHYDTTLGTRETTATSDALFTSGTNPLTYASFQLGEVTYTFSQIDSGSAGVNWISNMVQTNADNLDSGGTFELPVIFRQQLNLSATYSPPPAGVDVVTSASGDLGPSQAVFYEDTIIDKNTGQFTRVASQFDLGVATYSVEVNGAIPEPGTWALMILGFGAVGAMLRRSAVTA